ncbi:Egl nine 1 [Elasticomyces elasticus]|nr:Egl nine 1 [Elasticomyces elasticus]
MTDSTPTPPVRQVCAICGKGGYLFKCGRCKTSYYCSKPCQATNWPRHKIVCNFIAAERSGKTAGYECVVDRPEDTVVSVNTLNAGVVVYLTQDAPFYGYCGTSLLNFDGTSRDIVDLPITKALGFPLGTNITHKKSLFGPLKPNCKAAIFHIDIDTKSPSFGQPSTVPLGGRMLLRRDGRHIKIAHIVAVLEYLQQECKELSDVQGREAAGEKVDRVEIVKRVLTPAAFKKWCDSAQHDILTGKGRARGFEDYLECPPLDDGTTSSAEKEKKGKITKGKAKGMA